MIKNLSILKNAIFATILTFAILHIALLVVEVIVTSSISKLNIFKILGAETFLPAFLASTIEGDLISFLLVGSVFLAFYLIKARVK